MRGLYHSAQLFTSFLWNFCILPLPILSISKSKDLLLYSSSITQKFCFINILNEVFLLYTVIFLVAYDISSSSLVGIFTFFFGRHCYNASKNQMINFIIQFNTLLFIQKCPKIYKTPLIFCLKRDIII